MFHLYCSKRMVWRLSGLAAPLFAALFLCLPPSARAGAILLSGEMDNILIDQHAEWLEDRDGMLGIESVSRGAEFNPAGKKRTLNFGINDHAYWLRFTVINPLPRDIEWVYEIKEARMSHASIFWQAPDGKWISKSAGDHFPREGRELDLCKPTFLMKTPANTEQVIYVRCRFLPIGAAAQTAGIYSPGAYERATRAEYLLHGIYYGVLGIMFFYNLFLYFSVRDISYLCYVAYLISMAFFWVNMNGIGYAWLWGPSDYLVEGGGAALVGISLICVTVFTQLFLHTKELLPRYHRFLNLLHVLAGLILFLYVFRFTRHAVLLAYFGALVTVVFFAGGVLAQRAGFRAARFYTLSWSMFVLGACIYSLRDLGVLPFNQFTTLSAQAGNMLEIALLSFALADRIKFLQEEKAAAQAAAREKDQLLVETLRRAKEELETKVAERTAELKEQRDRAEGATQMKDKFVALVSHDLRSPLASINSAVGLVVKHIGGVEAARRVLPLVEGLGKSSASLLALIDQLLNISRLQTGKLVPSKKCVPLAELVDSKLEMVARTAEEKGVALVNDLPRGMKAAADPHLLGEVMGNLVSNAIKFSAAGGRVRFFAPDGDGGGFAVSDSGMGIDPEILPDLFRHEVKTTTLGTAGEKGTGLGLPYCMDIMTAHGGGIRVESESGKGTTFYVTLPLHATVVLIVDDQEAHRKIMKDILASSGTEATVLEAENGVEALREIGHMRPTLLITDVQMKPMNGLELLRAVKGAAGLRTIPVIIATSGVSSPAEGGMDALRKEAESAGADDFLVKPVDAADFLARVRRFLR